MKVWYESKSVWLGIITALIGVLGLIAEWLGRGDFSPASAALLIAGVLGVVLRVFFTDAPIVR